MRFWKRKKEEEVDTSGLELRMQAVPPSLTLHRFLLDSNLEEAHALSAFLPLKPLENVEEEVDFSEERLHWIAPLRPMLLMYSSALSGAFVDYMRSDPEIQPPLSEEEAISMALMLQKISMGTAMGAICQLEDMGLINYSYRSDK